MKTEDYKYWLMNVNKKSKKETSDNVSRIKRIEKAFTELNGSPFDIENECDKDGCHSLKNCLWLEKLPKTINLPNSYAGLSTLRAAVKKYMLYYSWREEQKNE